MVKRYVEQDYLRVDPVVAGCFQRFHPVEWKRLDWSSKAARAFRADAIAHGVGKMAALQAMFYLYAALGVVGAVLYTRLSLPVVSADTPATTPSASASLMPR